MDFLYRQDLLHVPREDLMLVEKYKSGKNYLIFHSMYGRRVNDVLSRAFGFLIGNLGGRDIEIGINDNGFYIAGERIQIKIWQQDSEILWLQNKMSPKYT